MKLSKPNYHKRRKINKLKSKRILTMVLLQAILTLDSELILLMKMELGMLVPFTWGQMKLQLRSCSILDLISLLSLVISALIQNLVSKNNMKLFSTRFPWLIETMVKILENVNLLLIFHKNLPPPRKWEVMMNILTMDLLN